MIDEPQEGVKQSNLLLTKINSVLFSCNSRLSLKNQASGYVLILMLSIIPVLLFGTKYVLDQMSADQARIKKGTEIYHKRCAREAALAVAKNWNPGLTLGQQKAAVYKVADAVYDNSPCYNDSVVGGAVAGILRSERHTMDCLRIFSWMNVGLLLFGTTISTFQAARFTNTVKRIALFNPDLESSGKIHKTTVHASFMCGNFE